MKLFFDDDSANWKKVYDVVIGMSKESAKEISN